MKTTMKERGMKNIVVATALNHYMAVQIIFNILKAKIGR